MLQLMEGLMPGVPPVGSFTWSQTSVHLPASGGHFKE